jgi:two-component system LytT family response regulator
MEDLNIKKIALSSRKGVEFVPFDDIIFCQAEGSYSSFFLIGDRKILVSKPIKHYANTLPKDLFFRCHKSFLIQIKHLTHLDKSGDITMSNGMSVRCAKVKRDMILALFIK